jgi:hypothetical protein
MTTTELVNPATGEVLRTVELVEAAYRSVQSHQPEPVIVHPY